MDEISELLGRQLTFYNHITHKSGSVSCLPKGREFDLALLEAELKGKTLLVYWYMLRASGFKVGVREVQRKLGFSSPSVAVYHLDKLESLGLVEKTVTGEYVLTSQVKTGLLRFFTRFGRFLVPRYMFYSVWFTTMLVSYIIFYGQSFCIHNVAALIFGFAASCVLWFETFRLWREKPF
jgi:predicted DNA-binding transcriptional regulator